MNFLKKKPLTATVLSALILAGCQSLPGQGEGGTEEFFNNARTLTFETVEQQTYANYEVEAQNRVIRDAAVFGEFWNRLHEGQNPLPPVPEIDFSRDMVVVTVLGTKPTGGYDTEITEIAAGGGRVGILVTNGIPGSDCGVTTALTNPYHIVRLERSDLEAAFYKEEAVKECSG